MSHRIYLVEDEVHLNQVLVSYLEQEGWQVRSFTNGEEAREAIAVPPDLWILDIMVPRVDGFELLREIKAQTPDIPVIFISARDAELDRVIGLEMGSDDYLPKPFLPRELVIRTRKLLERVFRTDADAGSSERIWVEPYWIDVRRRLVSVRGETVDLTAREFDLLLLFASHRGQAFAREQILTCLWGDDYFGSDRVVDDLVRRLRKKLPELRVETIYGYGYRMMMA